jgi:phage terminase large subunit-like protein
MNIDVKISEFQRKVMESKAFITLASGGRGSGKTAVASLIAILALMKGERSIVISPTYRMSKDVNFRQCSEFIANMGLSAETNLSSLRIRMGTGEIIFMSGETPERLRGYTSISKIIIDEMASVSEDCFKLAMPTMRDLGGRERKIYLVGSPPADESHWAAQLAMRDDVETMHASARDNPFVEPDYLETMEKEYEQYPDDFKRRELYGEFIFQGSSGNLFDDFRIEARNDWRRSRDLPVVMGLDIAGNGRDFTCAVVAQGRHVMDVRLAKTRNDEELKQFARIMLATHGFDAMAYDSTSIGHLITFGGLEGKKIVRVNFGASGGERFANARSSMYYRARKLDGITMSQPLMDEHGSMLLGELKATRLREQDGRKLAFVPKEEVKKAIGRSPDRADAWALAASYEEARPAPPRIAPLVFGRR